MCILGSALLCSVKIVETDVAELGSQNKQSLLVAADLIICSTIMFSAFLHPFTCFWHT